MNHFESPLFLCSFLFSSHVYQKKKKSVTLTIENVKPNVRVTDKIRQSKLAITILRFEIPFRDRDWKTLDQLEKEFLYILKKKNNPFVFFFSRWLRTKKFPAFNKNFPGNFSYLI